MSFYNEDPEGGGQVGMAERQHNHLGTYGSRNRVCLRQEKATERLENIKGPH